MTTGELWAFLPIGYVLTVLVETPILFVGLSKPHPWSRRLLAGLWLTACTYPVVVLVLPCAIDHTAERGLYLIVAETFAPVAECLLFFAAFAAPTDTTGQRVRDGIAITLANLASFGIGEWVFG